LPKSPFDVIKKADERVDRILGKHKKPKKEETSVFSAETQGYLKEFLKNPNRVKAYQSR